MADETADVSNKEQLVICIRWVDEDLIAHEDFIGMHPTERTTADVIVHVLKVLANSVKKSKHITNFRYTTYNVELFSTFYILF
jgi:bifunctional DNase/RNase